MQNTAQSSAEVYSENPTKGVTPLQSLILKIEALLAQSGYELVHLETVISRQKILRIFIDHLATGSEEPKLIGMADCVAVNKLLDEPLETYPEIETLFKGPYELEVSSPGLDRPLRKPSDFTKYSGKEIRIHLFRPLTAEECENADYQIKNPKQKNYLGRLAGLLPSTKIALEIDAGREKPMISIRIPFHLVSKCNIEPQINLKGAEAL